MLYNRGESHLYTEPSESAGSVDYRQPCEEVCRCEFVFDSTEQQKCNILTKTSNMAFFSKLWQRPQEKQAATIYFCWTCCESTSLVTQWKWDPRTEKTH